MEVLLGLIIAMAIGLTGVGAGTLTAPALILWFDVPPAIAVGTALAFGAAVKLPAIVAYLRRGQVDFATFRRMALGGIPGVLLGGVLLQGLDHGRSRGVVLVLVGVVVVASAAFSLLRRAPTEPAVASERRSWLAPVSAAIGVEVGFSSAGAGALGTVALFHLTSLTAAQVVGTDLLFGLSLAAVGGSLQAAFGSWDPTLLLRLLSGGIVGAIVGANLAVAVPPRMLRTGLMVWLLYVGGHMTLKGVGVLAVAL
ncbi:sulfite exporter TauE/SafE family protein [Paraliomyxa miuraensis]|uniref:sulfite exporter TauE/SafE family protein n=1 Tax=Paraliomyxa miuraensis TaxID=376150 RepID=UPI002256784C|nr:sulfite exporter TauE/SafE family protein [Paraliomyxa miuraensis]MCX4246805.1 sulfite exporter TauE/SafE family protein [Paraliomyxa miuraensis]